MWVSTSTITALAVATIGALILWANPGRLVNRTVASSSFHTALWLIFHHGSTSVADGLIWFRWTASIGALIPLHLWVVKESIQGAASGTLRLWLSRAWPWALPSLVLCIIPLTDIFIPAHSTSDARVVGWGYYVFAGGLLAVALALARDAFVAMRALAGVRRLEMQIYLGGGAAASLSIVALMALGVVVENPRLILLRPFVILCGYAVATIAITTSRVFDAKHLLFIALRKILLVSTVAGLAYVTHSLLAPVVPAAIAVLATTTVGLALAAQLNQWLDHVLQLYPGAAEARSRALAIAMQEMRQDPLKEAFVGILRGWSRSENASILIEKDGAYVCGELLLPAGSRLTALIKELRWVTVERLARERENVDRLALKRFMEEHALGVVALSSGPEFNIIVAVGTRPTRRPFTYPEVQQLLELASIFQTALARSFLWSKAQRAEQLATVGLLGASVAHEIRNPLVTIKSFVHLLPHHYDDKNFRERFFRLIGEEVGRIDRLTEQLLDLAAPRHYNPVSTSLHQIISTSLELVATKADERHVTLHRDLQAQPDIVFTDPNATRQVLLNLCFNGIQAQDQSSDGRWLKLTTRNVSRGVELCVSDHGPGIPAEARGQLFQAFHSTKSSGFGLGLAICSEILSSLNTTIAVDPFVPDEGAVFRIVFPCPPPTS
jgi:signal transduction histidine kinase